MKNVLIVDDQEEMRNLYSEIFFDNFGEIELTFSPDGIDAYMKCSLFQYDSIILDHHMPRLKGLDLLVAIRNTPGSNQKTPIVCISAFLPDFDKNKSILEDVIFIDKPFEVDFLVDHLKKILE